MRTVTCAALGVLLAAVAAPPVSAQDELIGLDSVYRLFTARQAHAAARMLSMVSVDFRRELGRCHDEALGARMMQTEPKFDALAAKIASGAVTSAAALEKEFGEYDHVLAEHHQQLAAEGWAKPRVTTMNAVARDISLAALYFRRAARWTQQPLSGDAQKAVDDALGVARRLAADPASPPPETPVVIDALGRVVRPLAGRVAERGS